MKLKYRLLNSMCMLAYKSEYKRFMKLFEKSACVSVQKKKLLDYVRRNENTEFGRRYHFREINSYEDYAKRVPLSRYEDYEEYISRIRKGEKNVLTEEEVLMFELTSGSSGGKKLIPYTKTLKEEFQKGIYPWLYDLNKNVRGVRDGASYWSITPVTSRRAYTECGIPIGFEEDAEYFGRFVQGLMNEIFAVDSKEVKFIDNMQEFYRKTAIGILKDEKTALISVWNPTFLSILCDYIRDEAGSLEEELGWEKGRISEAANRGDFTGLFPNLKLVSCWADGNAANQIKDLEEKFKGVLIQPKGILATECFVSFPTWLTDVGNSIRETASFLSVYSHFFEFKNLLDGEICMIDGLKVGDYELIVTTGGGLYRYCMGDVIRVLSADCDKPPIIRFLRRNGISTDICGEKLTEDFVRNVIMGLGMQEDFCLLTPENNGYVLFTDNINIDEEAFDAALRESFHYNYCRELGQLLRVRIVRIRDAALGNDIFTRRMVSQGVRLGDIKPMVLSRFSGWEEWFTRQLR